MKPLRVAFSAGLLWLALPATAFAQAPLITSATTASGITTEIFTFAVTTTPAAASYSLTGNVPESVTIDPETGIITRTPLLTINPVTGIITGTPVQTGEYAMTVLASNGGGIGVGSIWLTVNARPVITTQPRNASAAMGRSVTLSAAATGTPAPTYQWLRNGVPVPNATAATLTLSGLVSGDAGSYAVNVTNVTGTVRSQAAAVGIASVWEKVVGGGTEVGFDIAHPNGNVYDQVALTGASASIKADPTQITRTSFVDLTNDIVQVEFSGAGTLTIVLDNPSGPSAPAFYNQPGVTYMRGHASLIITDANETTNVSVFTVGSTTAVNQNLFLPGIPYDGVADIGLIAIVSTNGRFGGIRTANASYSRATGLTGIHAPGVAIEGPVFVGDVSGGAAAAATLNFGSTTDVRVTGGDLLQLNSGPIQVDGINQIFFTAGTKSSGQALPMQANRGQLQRNGIDVTTDLVR